MQLEIPERLETIVAIYRAAVPLTPAVPVERMLRELALFPEKRTPPDLSGVDLSQYVDNRYVDEAIAGRP